MNCKDLPLISVIVPVYNVEKYLERCVNSIITQTYSNIQILLIDDGSTDFSGKKCDEFADKDSRITVIHKTNGGLSDARNCGIENAKGSYVTFIDSDDSVAPDLIEYLYYLIRNYKCRMSVCSHFVALREGKKLVPIGNGQEEVIDAKTCIRKMCYHDNIDTSAWAKLYERSLFDGIQFPEGKLFEDIGTIYKTFINSKTIVCGYNPKYYYYVRENSIVTSRFSKTKLDLLEMTDKMGNDVLKLYPDLLKAVLRRKVYARFSTLNQMLDTSEYQNERNEIINYIRKNSLFLLKNKTPFRDKLGVISLLIGIKCYRYVWKVYKFLKFK